MAYLIRYQLSCDISICQPVRIAVYRQLALIFLRNDHFDAPDAQKKLLICSNLRNRTAEVRGSIHLSSTSLINDLKVRHAFFP